MRFPRNVPRFWLLCWLLVFVAACQQNPAYSPEVHGVYPDLIGAGEERYLIVQGDRFLPLIRWPAGEGQASIEDRFTVRIDAGEEIEANVLSPERLVFMIPGDLTAGHHSLTVIGPNGKAQTLTDALCIDDTPRVELVYTCADPEKLNLCVTPMFEDGETRVLIQDTLAGVWEGAGQSQTDTLQNAYALSPDGNRIVFMRIVERGAGQAAQLVLSHLEEKWEVVLIETAYPPFVPDNYSMLKTPVVSPDGEWVTYIRDNRDLLLQRLPRDAGSVEEPELLYREPVPESGWAYLLYPEIDPGFRYVLFTRVKIHEADADYEVSLLLATLADRTVRPLLDQETNPRPKDGPGTFLPSGEEILFLSDRANLYIPTPFGFMSPATQLYVVDLRGGPVRSFNMTIAAYLYGKPVISPNGKLVATNGFMADVSGSGLDLVVTDLTDGWMSRVGTDPVEHCFPRDVSENCKQPNEEREYSLPCCADENNLFTCCQYNPAACPTWDLGPVFYANSHLLVSNVLSTEWRCNQGTNPDDPYIWEQEYRSFYLNLATLAENGLVLDDTTLSSGLPQLPAAPLFRQRLNCPVDEP